MCVGILYLTYVSGVEINIIIIIIIIIINVDHIRRDWFLEVGDEWKGVVFELWSQGVMLGGGGTCHLSCREGQIHPSVDDVTLDFL